jgi:hypothetical protein
VRPVHDDLCPLKHLSVLKSGCPQCELVRAGRQDGLRLALQAVDTGGRAAKQIAALLAAADA